jgi:hypothetical protein
MYKASVSSGSVQQIMPYRYYGSLVTWTVVCLTETSNCLVDWAFNYQPSSLLRRLTNWLDSLTTGWLINLLGDWLHIEDAE